MRGRCAPRWSHPSAHRTQKAHGIGKPPTRPARRLRSCSCKGANPSPDNPSWRDGFVLLQERGRVVFSAAVDGRVYARHGTTTETRLTVIDRVPAGDPATFPASPSTAGDTATLLDWVTRHVPARAAVAVAPAIARVVAPITTKALRAPPLPSTRSDRSSTAEHPQKRRPARDQHRAARLPCNHGHVSCRVSAHGVQRARCGLSSSIDISRDAARLAPIRKAARLRA
jgi:hypothetical protein